MNLPLRKTIVFIIPMLYRAGAERVLHEIATHLDSNVYDRHIVCFYEHPNSFQFDSDIKRYYFYRNYAVLTSTRFPLKIKKWIRGIAIAFRLTKLLASFPKNTIVVCFLEFTSIKAALAKLLFGYSIIARPASTGYASIRYHFKRPWRQKIEKLCLKIDFACADKIVVQSEGVKLDYINNFSIPDKKLQVIPNPVDLKLIRTRRNDSINLLPETPDNLTVFSHVGRLVEKKNHQLLIKASALLKIKYNNFIILCAGSGPLAPIIKQRIKEIGLEKNIIMVGELDNPFALMAKSRALILTSQHESFSIVLVEAMACGSTVISTDCPYGPSEILANGKFGVLVPPNDPQSLADAMFNVAKNDKLVRDLRKKVEQRAKQYDVQIIVKLWEHLLSSVQKGRR